MLLAAVRPAQGQDEAIVEALAGVIATADARRYDGPLLTTAARHPDPLVRRQTALALGRIGDPAALTTLLELFLDRDTTVRRDAAFALGLLGDAGAVETLGEFIANAPAESQTAYHTEAATALLKVAQADSSVRPAIADFVQQMVAREQPRIEAGETTPIVQRLILEAWRLGEAAPVRQLVQVAETRDPAARRRAVYALMRLRAPAAATVMMAAVDDADVGTREHAVRTLTRQYAEAAGMEPGAAADRVSRRVEDEDVGVRINALRALGTYGDARYASAAADRIDDPEATVRVQALAALGQLGGEEARRMLDEAVDDGSFAEQQQALWGLARVDRGRGIARAARWITSDEWRHRASGTNALAILGGDTAAAWLEALTADPDHRVAAAAYGALGRLDSARARQLAPGLLEHPDLVVRTLAENRIGETPAPGDVARLSDAYARALNDRESDARIAAVQAIGTAAERDPSAAFAVDDVFLARFPRADDYLVRRAAAEHLPSAAR
ncbi:MAG: HEAT repeat domain-containing protein, partial [Gemmatimonadales bacterium]